MRPDVARNEKRVPAWRLSFETIVQVCLVGESVTFPPLSDERNSFAFAEARATMQMVVPSLKDDEQTEPLEGFDVFSHDVFAGDATRW